MTASRWDSGRRRVVAGVDLGGTKIDIALVDTRSGESLRTARLSTHPEAGGEAVVSRAFEAAAALAAELSLAPTALALAVPGVVNDGVVSLADNIPHLDGLALQPIARRFFGDIPFAVVNDLKAAAAREADAGTLAGVDIGLLIGLGTGIASGVVVGGRLVAGHSGAAGEIGLTQVAVPSIAGEAVSAEVTAALEQVAGGRAFDELAQRHGMRDAAEFIARRAERAEWTTEWEARTEALVTVLSACCHLLDPQRLVFFGGLSHNDDIRQVVAIALAHRLPRTPDLIWYPRERNAALLGAVHVARLLLERANVA